MTKVIVIGLAVLSLVLTGCTKSATITAETGIGSSDQPYIDCHVGVPNPDYMPPATTRAG